MNIALFRNLGDMKYSISVHMEGSVLRLVFYFTSRDDFGRSGQHNLKGIKIE